MALCLLMTPSRALSQKDTADAIFVVRQMQEKCIAVNKHIYITSLAPRAWHLRRDLTVSLEYLSGGS